MYSPLRFIAISCSVGHSIPFMHQASAESVEEEVDAGDPVRGAGQELTGEDLLRAHYRVLFPARGPPSAVSAAGQLQSQQQPRLSTPLPPAALAATS